MVFCVLVADATVSLKSEKNPGLPIVVENMINMCDDKDSDVRMVAEESLNRIIMVRSDTNYFKKQLLLSQE